MRQTRACEALDGVGNLRFGQFSFGRHDEKARPSTRFSIVAGYLMRSLEGGRGEAGWRGGAFCLSSACLQGGRDGITKRYHEASRDHRVAGRT